jgi:hypothetical protein
MPDLRGEAAQPRPVTCESYTWWPTGTVAPAAPGRTGTSSNRMVRHGPWKLCYYGAYDSYELFHLVDDPDERHDLARLPQHADIIRELSGHIFTDGWSPDTAHEVDRRLATFGHLANTKGYRDALLAGLRSSPRPVESSDTWNGPPCSIEPDPG